MQVKEIIGHYQACPDSLIISGNPSLQLPAPSSQQPAPSPQTPAPSFKNQSASGFSDQYPDYPFGAGN